MAKFARFVVFGGLAAIVNLALGRSLYGDAGTSAWLPYWLAVTIATSAGMAVNFSLNYAWNFTYRGRSPLLQFRTFVIVATIGVGLTALIAELTLPVLQWSGLRGVTIGSAVFGPQFLSHVFAVGAVTFYSFAAHNAFSFNRGIRAWLHDRGNPATRAGAAR